MNKFTFNKYFFRQFIIYFLLIAWFIFVEINNIVDDIYGVDVKSTVKFVYEAF